MTGNGAPHVIRQIGPTVAAQTFCMGHKTLKQCLTEGNNAMHVASKRIPRNETKRREDKGGYEYRKKEGKKINT